MIYFFVSAILVGILTVFACLKMSGREAKLEVEEEHHEPGRCTFDE